jgi:hypothetical protein
MLIACAHVFSAYYDWCIWDELYDNHANTWGTWLAIFFGHLADSHGNRDLWSAFAYATDVCVHFDMNVYCRNVEEGYDKV